MRDLYKTKTANYLRLKTDTFFSDYSNVCKYIGFVDDVVKYIENFQLLDSELWSRFVNQFREKSDTSDKYWRCEYWGKMMRGASFVYSYTQNENLYGILSQTVRDMIDSSDEFGRISTYYVKDEFDGWDIWGRKYVLLGMQYFLEICNEEDLIKEIVISMCKQVDYIICKIGNEDENKKPITSASRHWRGLNSSSLLEPIVRLYSITEEKKYLDFAQYIVSCGGTDISNIFELAWQNELYPYQYPVTKAYEMISCFEGLLEYYRITKIEKYKTAIINFADKILESDFTVIGSCGCTNEFFDHSTVRQANTNNERTQQETCVTVTLMKFFYQINILTGESKYIDAFEISFYNAYLGAINTEKAIEPSIYRNHSDWNISPLPFDSYSPLTAGIRGNGVAGLLVMSDKHYYSCCACIGSAGIGLVPKAQLLTTKTGFAFNLFINGTIESRTPEGNKIIFSTKTFYPRNGVIDITIELECEEEFDIMIRNPRWSKTTSISVSNNDLDITDEYVSAHKMWENGDTIKINLDMRTEAIYPIPYGTQVLMNKIVWKYNYMIPTFDKEDPIACRHIALRRGPVMLAQENRLGYSVDDPVSIKVNDDGFVDVVLAENNSVCYPNIISANIPLTDGKTMLATDYSSAGKLWTDESKMAVWILTK